MIKNNNKDVFWQLAKRLFTLTLCSHLNRNTVYAKINLIDVQFFFGLLLFIEVLSLSHNPYPEAGLQITAIAHGRDM